MQNVRESLDAGITVGSGASLSLRHSSMSDMTAKDTAGCIRVDGSGGGSILIEDSVCTRAHTYTHTHTHTHHTMQRHDTIRPRRRCPRHHRPFLSSARAPRRRPSRRPRRAALAAAALAAPPSPPAPPPSPRTALYEYRLSEELASNSY